MLQSAYDAKQDIKFIGIFNLARVIIEQGRPQDFSKRVGGGDFLRTKLFQELGRYIKKKDQNSTKTVTALVVE